MEYNSWSNWVKKLKSAEHEEKANVVDLLEADLRLILRLIIE